MSEGLKKMHPNNAAELDKIQFDIELNFLRFVRGYDVNIEALDDKWSEWVDRIIGKCAV